MSFALIVFENTKHEKPMAGDLIRVYKTNDPLYPVGVLGVIKGEVNTVLSQYDILLEPALPINVLNGFIDVNEYSFELKNVEIEKITIMKGQPTNKMLFEDSIKYPSGTRKLGIFTEVKLFKIHL